MQSVPTTFNPIRGRGRGQLRPRGAGGAPPRGGAAAPSFSHHHHSTTHGQDDDDSDQVAQLRKKHGSKLSQASELFPDWTDEDLLFAIQGADGDVATAILRISEGHEHQFSAVKAKKVKKELGTVTPPTSAASSRGGFAARGRGGLESSRGARGGRGVARGGIARGGFAPSAPRANAESTGPVSSEPTPAAWGTPTPATTTDATTTPDAASSGWGEPAPVDAAPAAEGWSAPAPVATGAWGARAVEPEVVAAPVVAAAPTNGNGPAPAAVVESVGDGWGTPAPVAKPVSKTIAPGSKMSWAQVARPPVKATPPPLKPVVIAPVTPIVVPKVIEEAIEPIASIPAEVEVLEEAPLPTVSLPERHPQPESALPAQSASWNEAPTPGPLDAWGTQSQVPEPSSLGVGEGWADAVVASHETESAYAQRHSIPEAVTDHLPPNDINAAGPISVSSVTPTATQDENAAASAPQVAPGAGPPGLPKRASNRPQQEAVVMPNTQGVERIGVQFGSLNLFDGQPTFTQDASAQQQESVAPQQPSQQQSYQNEHQAYSQDQQQKYQQQPVQQQQQQQHHHQQQLQDQGVQTSFSQGPNSFNQYPANPSPYGAPQQQQQHQQHQPQQQQQHQQQQVQTEEQQHSSLGSNAASSPYAPFKRDAPAAVSSPYYQQNLPSHSPIPPTLGQNPQTSYGAFNSLPQAAPAASDYYSAQAAGVDPLRSMGFYNDPYNQAHNQAAFQNPSPVGVPAVEAATGSASHTPTPPSVASASQAPQQNQPYPQMNSPYYPQQQQYAAAYYGYNQYNQAPNYGAPGGYGQQPNYQQYPQQQQFARYAPPTGQNYQRGGVPAGQQQTPYGQQQQQQQQQQSYGQQAYGYGGYEQPQALQQQRPAQGQGQPQGQGQGQAAKEREYNSKDLDRFF